MPTNYNARLTANNAKIDNITTMVNDLPDADEINEKLDAQDAIIENLKSIVNEKAEPTTFNIFTQLTEPETKKGIWLQTDKEYENVVFDDYIEDIWGSNNTNIPYNFSEGSVVSIDTDIYLMGGTGSASYKYDTLADMYTQINNISNYQNGGCASVGTNIYLFGTNKGTGNNKAYKYDTLTGTYTQLTNIPYNFAYGGCTSIGTNIYLFGSSSNSYNAYKYDTLTDTYTKLTNIPYQFYMGGCTSVGTDIYLMGGTGSYSKYNYKYDTLLDTYTRLTDIPYQFQHGSCTSVGTNIYLFGSNFSSSYYRYAYKYDTLTDTYARLVDVPYDFYYGGCTSVGTNIYLFGGNGGKTMNYVLHIVNNKIYTTDNIITIAQGKAITNYNTKLIDITSISNNYQPLTEFSDIGYYTIQDGFDFTIPTYYGDGTQWINIKNPVSNE